MRDRLVCFAHGQAAIAREGAVTPLVERLHGDMMKAAEGGLSGQLGRPCANALTSLACPCQGTAIVALRNLASQNAENQANIAKASCFPKSWRNFRVSRFFAAASFAPSNGSGQWAPLALANRQARSCRWSSFSKMECGVPEPANTRLGFQNLSDETSRGKHAQAKEEHVQRCSENMVKLMRPGLRPAVREEAAQALWNLAQARA